VTTVFLTGFPGFLGSALVERLLERYPADTSVTCLVQPKYREDAERRAEAIEASADADGRVRLVGGDITEEDLGLGADYDELQSDAVEVFHLAAVYDLGVSREVGQAVNVEGTRNVLSFATGAPDLDRFQYVSTAYVSGRYEGTFTEDDLREAQQFNNYYETTKHLAEVLVQERMAEGLPATIYRPGITVGDSETGETQKFDGPYYLLQWIRRQPFVAVVPVSGTPEDHVVNVVPRDYVVDAMAYLSGLEESRGEVYHLTNPDPPTVADLLDLFSRETGTRVLAVPTPLCVSKGALERSATVRRLMRVEPAVVDYFVHPTRYDASNALAALSGTDVACPPVSSYVDRLVGYMRENPELGPDAMV
jgi:thioester reductase-like protein